MEQILEAIIGLQFGDEGKGKIVDKRVNDALSNGKKTIVIRFQGGCNAGHTIYAIDKHGNLIEFITHAAPSGLTSNADIAIGPNVAFDPKQFIKELNLAKDLFNYDANVFISERTGILLDYHKRLDAYKENNKKNIGTTKSGIGPFYIDNANRLTRLTLNDYVSDNFSNKLKEILEIKSNELKIIGIDDLNKYHEELVNEHNPIRKELKNYKSRLEYVLQDYLENGNIIIEGAQGAMLDIDMGSIPDVTASHLLAPHAFPSLGLPRNKFKIYGVEKIYPTRVGNGLLPTLDEEEFGPMIVKNSGEFGATTGRMRRVGYPDWVMIKRSVMLNDCDGIYLTRVDNVQDYNLKICTAYELNDGIYNEMPLDLSEIKNVIYTNEFKFKLWDGNNDLSDALKMDSILKEQRMNYVNGKELPNELKEFIKYHDEFVKCPIVGISIGPGRDEIVKLK